MKQVAFAIYDDRSEQQRGPTRERAPLAIVSSVVEPQTPPLVLPAVAQGVTERAILEVLDERPAVGETIELAYRRKEHALGELFAQLTIIEAHTLKKRLENPKAGDALATKFTSLIASRRVRLLAFLGDARRREALALARRK